MFYSTTTSAAFPLPCKTHSYLKLRENGLYQIMDARCSVLGLTERRLCLQSLLDQGQGQAEMPRGRKRSEDHLDVSSRHHGSKRHRTSQHCARSVHIPVPTSDLQRTHSVPTPVSQHQTHRGQHSVPTPESHQTHRGQHSVPTPVSLNQFHRGQHSVPTPEFHQTHRGQHLVPHARVPTPIPQRPTLARLEL